MTMLSVEECTWFSLEDYIKEHLACYSKMLDDIWPDLDQEQQVTWAAACRRLSYRYEWFLPLVREMQKHPAILIIHPVLSVDAIRLLFPASFSGKVKWLDTAWITVCGDGLYCLSDFDDMLLLGKNARARLVTTCPCSHWTIEGDVSEMVFLVKQLVFEMSNQNKPKIYRERI